MNSGLSRKNIHLGDTVDVVQKRDQRTGKITRGVVKEILTNSPSHPHGIKVRLQTGQVGRVQAKEKNEERVFSLSMTIMNRIYF
ncbi:MAG: YwbE family protein [Candidatus Thorarchaeota archaeon]|nr:YwbE family protein [Candidatus Thorarchaeota archaeon]